MAKKNKTINVFVGEHEIKLPDKLLNKIIDEIMKQVKGDIENADFEVRIEVNHIIETIEKKSEEPLSDFNQKLKQALNYNPKAKKE